MKNILEYKVILWDFDGVIMDSMPIRGIGFEQVLQEYPREQIEELLSFHHANGGLSRYVKFKYFFEEIRKEVISEDQIIEMAERFSKIMLTLLIDEKLLILDSVNFIKNNWSTSKMHIVSGSDGQELNLICKGVKINEYFLSIEGSPTPKNKLIHNLLKKYNYSLDDVVLIGDSVNDYDAAVENGISFYGFNNVELTNYTSSYVYSFYS